MQVGGYLVHVKHGDRRKIVDLVATIEFVIELERKNP